MNFTGCSLWTIHRQLELNSSRGPWLRIRSETSIRRLVSNRSVLRQSLDEFYPLRLIIQSTFICTSLSPPPTTFDQSIIHFNSHSLRDPSCIETSQIVGFILNVPTDYKFGFVVLPFKRRHWIAVRKIGKDYWNLDSKLDRPENIGNEEDLLSYLKNLLSNNDKELFVVVSSETEKTKNWMKLSETANLNGTID